jgi:hypothetical protein
MRGRWGDGEMGRRGDGETGRRGDGETGRLREIRGKKINIGEMKNRLIRIYTEIICIVKNRKFLSEFHQIIY